MSTVFQKILTRIQEENKASVQQSCRIANESVVAWRLFLPFSPAPHVKETTIAVQQARIALAREPWGNKYRINVQSFGSFRGSVRCTTIAVHIRSLPKYPLQVSAIFMSSPTGLSPKGCNHGCAHSGVVNAFSRRIK